jgi:hypothetical protein
MSRIFVAGALLLAAACAGSSPHVSSVSSVRLKDHTEKDGYVAGVVDTMNPEELLLCGMETTTGTHIAKRICRSEGQLALVHQHTQDWLRQLHPTVGTGNAVSSNGRTFTAP